MVFYATILWIVLTFLASSFAVCICGLYEEYRPIKWSIRDYLWLAVLYVAFTGWWIDHWKTMDDLSRRTNIPGVYNVYSPGSGNP